ARSQQVMLKQSRAFKTSFALSVIWLALLPAASVSNLRAAPQTNHSDQTTMLDNKSIDAIIGRSGEMKDNVYKIGLPRTDLKVRAGGVDIKPALALGSWMAFKRMGDHTTVMGDLVLLESELNPVLAKLEENGIEVSAIHNHV